MKSSRIIIFSLLIINSFNLIAQGELIDEVRKATSNEHSYLIAINSNGFMGSMQWGKRLNGFRKRTFDIDFAYVKDSKEIRVENPYYQNNKKFVFGKLYTMFSVRSGLGLQRELYSIYDKGGIALRMHYSLGAVVGLLKPIYYEVVDSTKIINNTEYIYVSDKQFDYNIHQITDIYSRSPFTKGINETKFIPGIYAKLGLSFVFSEKQEVLNALDLGIILDTYTQPIQIMMKEKKDRFFVTLYIGYRFGKVKIKNLEQIKEDINTDETSNRSE